MGNAEAWACPLPNHRAPSPASKILKVTEVTKSNDTKKGKKK
jgi:hypothetical protein